MDPKTNRKMLITFAIACLMMASFIIYHYEDGALAATDCGKEKVSHSLDATVVCHDGKVVVVCEDGECDFNDE